MIGIGVCAAWSFGVTFVLLRLLNRVIPLRVPADFEDRGLNLAEHGENEDYEIPVEAITTTDGAVAVESERRDQGNHSVDPIAEQEA